MSDRPDWMMNLRRNLFKDFAVVVDARKRRHEDAVQIRKNRKDETLHKKRIRQPPATTTTTTTSSSSSDVVAINVDVSMEDMVAGVCSDDDNTQLQAIIRLNRMLFSAEGSPPIDEVVQAGVVPRVVQFLGRDDFESLQFHAAGLLANIAGGSSENTKAVTENGAVPLFVKLLSSPHNDVREMSVWALGNIAIDSNEYRDLVLSFEALSPLLAQFSENATLPTMRLATWTLSNLCSGMPGPHFEKTKDALPVLRRLIDSSDDEILSDACTALGCLSDDKDSIQGVIGAGVCPRLVELLLHQTPTVFIPALHTVANITGVDRDQIQHVVGYQALRRLVNLLITSDKKRTKKEACRIFSLITPGSREHKWENYKASNANAQIWI